MSSMKNNQYKKIGRPRLLIVGCGDIGLRLLPWLCNKYRVFATTTQEARCPLLRAKGAVPLVVDLNHLSSQMIRMAHLADVIIHLVPPNVSGESDFRTRHLISVLPHRAKVIYISTTGVYGDCHGQWVDETNLVRPNSARAKRRVDAEQALRHWAIRQQGQLCILRVAGIYAGNRLPIARIKNAEPLLVKEEDVYINLIHAEDLVQAIQKALYRRLPQRIYHISDDSDLLTGDYMDAVAHANSLPLSPRIKRADLSAEKTPMMNSLVSSSKRLINDRMKTELGVTLHYPTVYKMLEK